MTRVAVLGMGAMGSRMADRLEAAGFDVVRWNRTGANLTPRDAVAGVHVVIAMVHGDEASEAVWLDPETGALAGMDGKAVAIESSTLSLAQVERLGAACDARGIALLDAPVLGSRPQAEAGALIHLVGGDETLLESVRPVLGAMGAKQLHVGERGSGAALKLAANALFAIQVVAMAELCARLRAGGVEPGNGVALLEETPLLSPAARAAASLMLTEKDDALFPIELVAKDLRYAIAETPDGSPMAGAALECFERMVAAGHGGLNLTGVRLAFA